MEVMKLKVYIQRVIVPLWDNGPVLPRAGCLKDLRGCVSELVGAGERHLGLGHCGVAG